MSTRSKIVYLFVALIFVFTSLAGGAFAAVQMAAHDVNVGFHVQDAGSPAYSIAGDCDMAMSCGSGSG
jgi:hypothetical protein